MDTPISAQTITLTGAGGDEIEAYRAQPTDTGSRGGVVLIHHMPGWDRWSKEVARRFAVDGYDVLAPNLYSREAPGAEPDDAAAISRAQGWVPDERLVGDVAAAVDYLRALPSANSKVAVIGHCSGGRQSVLAAASLQLQGAVDCYGGGVSRPFPPEAPIKLGGLMDKLETVSCPILGLFGNDDASPSPEDVATLDARLTELGKEHEFHSYDGAGHAFFCADRPSYRVEAALDGYQRIAAFFSKVLG